MAVSLTQLRKARNGVAGLEFALLSPILLTLFLGTIDISGALLTARRMGVAAGAIAEIATTSSAQTQALNVLTDVQAWQATTAAFATFPEWTDRLSRNRFAIALSDVTFTAEPADCRTKCSYKPRVMWSVANDLGVAQLRACGPLTVVPNNSVTSFTTLPAGNLGPTSLIIADIAYTFRPMFFGFLFGDIPMMQSAYLSPRINNDTQLVPAGGSVVSVNCAASS